MVNNNNNNNNNKFNILLVEDNLAHAKLIILALEESGPHEIHHLKNGADALSYLRREGDFERASRPHLVILDLKLPLRNGHEVLRVVKQDECLRKIPIVILTTSDNGADKEYAYINHANSFVQKPADAERFSKAVIDIHDYWHCINVV